MQETLLKYKDKVVDGWNALEKGQRIRLISIVVILIISLAVTIYITTKPRLVVLQSSQDLKTVGQIQTALTTAGIYNKVTDNGTVVQVKQQDASDALLTLAIQNLPTEGTLSYQEAIANSGMGTTETIKRQNFNIYTQSVLSKTISDLTNVNKAEVLLNIPPDDNFYIESKQKSSASVKLDLKSPLSENQIMGIASFIANSVQGLEVDRIAIMDSKGNPLNVESPDALSNNTKYKVESQKTADKIATAQTMLQPIFDDVRVAANLNFDWSKLQENTTTYTPIEGTTKGIVNEVNAETAEVTNGTTGVEPGLTNNGGQVPQYNTDNGNNSTANTNKSSTKYLVNQSDKSVEKSPGDINYDASSLSIIVYNNKVYREADAKTKGLLANQTWDEYKDQIKSNLVKLNIDQGIIDSVSNSTGIKNISIVGYEKPEFVDVVKPNIPIETIIMVAILVLLIALLAYGLIRRTEPEEVIETEPELSVEELLVSTQQQQKQQEEVKDIEYAEESEVKRQLEKFVIEKPEQVAQLLRNWLSDEWE